MPYFKVVCSPSYILHVAVSYTNHSYEKIAVLMCVCMYVAIHCPHASSLYACAHIMQAGKDHQCRCKTLKVVHCQLKTWTTCSWPWPVTKVGEALHTHKMLL